MCTFCESNAETITHLLIKCSCVAPLWDQLVRWCEYYYTIRIHLDPSTIIFNNYRGQCKNPINMFIVILKQYIYSSKCFNKVPTFIGFVQKLSYWYFVEREIFYQMGKTKIFYKKWQHLF